MGSAAVSKTGRPRGGSSRWRKASPGWPSFQALSKTTGPGVPSARGFGPQ